MFRASTPNIKRFARLTLYFVIIKLQCQQGEKNCSRFKGKLSKGVNTILSQEFCYWNYSLWGLYKYWM